MHLRKNKFRRCILYKWKIIYYSLLSEVTGSFLDAILDGIRPAINVNSILITISAIAPNVGSIARPEILVIDLIIALIGINRITVMPIPIIPAVNPTMSVSALNTRETSLFEAPMARSIPISFVRSRTEI